MRRMRAVVCGVVLSAALAMTPAVAQDQQQSLDEAERMAMDAIARMMDALGLFIDSIPQYEAPEVLPNGDIIIRRIHPESESGPELQDGEEPEVDETAT